MTKEQHLALILKMYPKMTPLARKCLENEFKRSWTRRKR